MLPTQFCLSCNFFFFFFPVTFAWGAAVPAQVSEGEQSPFPAGIPAMLSPGTAALPRERRVQTAGGASNTAPSPPSISWTPLLAAPVPRRKSCWGLKKKYIYSRPLTPLKYIYIYLKKGGKKKKVKRTHWRKKKFGFRE